MRGATPSALRAGAIGPAEDIRAHRHFVIDGKTGDFDFAAYSHRSVKDALHEMSGGMCAYCESRYDATQPVDVEHFRPKGRIDTAGGKLVPGYWWLAARWSNLLPSCIDCNRERNQTLHDGSEMKMGKADRFPLHDEAARANAPDGEVSEMPLLLDPTADEPADFVRFVVRDERCVMEPVDTDMSRLAGLRGRTSIDVYGLNRRGLVRDRSRYVLRILVSLKRLEKLARKLDVGTGDAHEIEEDIADELSFLISHVDGGDRFTGMARSFVAPALEKLGLTI